jgi:hypothetical protein
VIFHENLNNPPIFPQPCNDVSDVDVLSDIREVGDAPTFNDRATVSDSVISTNSAESIDLDINAVVEPLHGNEQPEVNEENETWILEKLLIGRRIVKSKWIFKIKCDSSGHAIRFKARLVAIGFSQKESVDYEETFSPVVRHESVRTVLSIAAVEDLEILQLDVKTAFLNSEFKEKVFMDRPTGFISNASPTYICRLQKSLYGLK